mmetsp:Transcript_17213/g.39808  ORF Transcript_17213/g.39808 Transcript_17213/m.39808 type:complete len:123 (+) Transcript_17213:225-593(+)
MAYFEPNYQAYGGGAPDRQLKHLDARPPQQSFSAHMCRIVAFERTPLVRRAARPRGVRRPPVILARGGTDGRKPPPCAFRPRACRRHGTSTRTSWPQRSPPSTPFASRRSRAACRRAVWCRA